MRIFVVALLALLVVPTSAFAQEESSFAVTDDAIAAFVQDHGGIATFGQPISRELTVQGRQMQIFENAALQVGDDGTVSVLQVTTPGWLPFTHFDGLTVPAEDPALAFVAPTPDQSNYDPRLKAFLSATVAFDYDTSVWGMPTSAAVADPNNPNFVYQRFQNGIIMLSSGSPLAMGEYLKDVLTGQNLPADLASEASASPLYKQLAGSDAFVPDGL